MTAVIGDLAKDIPSSVEVAVLVFFMCDDDDDESCQLGEDSVGSLKTLVENLETAFKKINKPSKRAQVIWLPMNDPEDEASVEKVKQTLPKEWIKAPCDEKKDGDEDQEGLVLRLGDLYNVAENPGVVILDAKTGDVINSGQDALAVLMNDTDADKIVERFPWPPLTLKDVIGETFESADGSSTSWASIQGGTVAFLFSVAPELNATSGEFVTSLKAAYKKANAAGNKFEVIIVPQNMDEEQMMMAAQFMQGEEDEDAEEKALPSVDFPAFRKGMPWLSIPFDDTERAEDLCRLCEADPMQGYARGPQLYMFKYEGETLDVINHDATALILRDEEFPWRRPLVSDLQEAQDDDESILERAASASIIVVAPTNASEQKIDILQKEMLDVASKEKAAGRTDLGFFTAKPGDDICREVLDMVGIAPDGKPTAGGDPFDMKRSSWFGKDKQFLFALSLGEDAAAFASESTDVSVADFVASYRKGTLKTQAILTMGDEDDEEDEDTEGSVELGDEDTDDEE